MRMFTLSPRLSTAAGFLSEGALLADIGCDHGKLPIYAAKYLNPVKVIACDINEAPLARARFNCRRFSVGDVVELRLGNGLDPVRSEECTHITICGMGGETIASILSAAPWSQDGDHTLILQPETSAYKLRRFLYSNGYQIIDEKAVFDSNRVYSVLCAKGGAEPISASLLDEYASPALREKRDAAAMALFKRIKTSLERTMRGEQEDSERYIMLKTAKNDLEAIINAQSVADREGSR